MRKNNFGFTLVELLVVVSVMIVVVGVTGDIVITLVRSYNKTQITNEVGQNANFVMTKLEKELRNASSVLSQSSSELSFTRRLVTGSYETIIYSINDIGTISREVAGSGEGSVLLVNDSSPSGVYVHPTSSYFTDVTVSGGPTVIQINLFVRQIGNPAVQFTQDVELETTVVVRGSY